MSYDIADQLPEAEKHENYLDEFFRKKWKVEIESVDRAGQRYGIDRIWKWQSGARMTVEYKADNTADRTNNVFIETVSVDKDNKPGWAFTSLAQYLLYYIPPRKIAYFLSMTAIKKNVVWWKTQYKELPIQNKNYITYGLPVPIEELIEKCSAVKVEIKFPT